MDVLGDRCQGGLLLPQRCPYESPHAGQGPSRPGLHCGPNRPDPQHAHRPTVPLLLSRGVSEGRLRPWPSRSPVAQRGCGARGPSQPSRRVPIAGSTNTAPHAPAGAIQAKGRDRAPAGGWPPSQGPSEPAGLCRVPLCPVQFSRRMAWKQAQKPQRQAHGFPLSELGLAPALPQQHSPGWSRQEGGSALSGGVPARSPHSSPIPRGYCHSGDHLVLDISSGTKSAWATPADTLHVSRAPREVGGGAGCQRKPSRAQVRDQGDSASQKLDEAGRTLPWTLQREPGPADT